MTPPFVDSFALADSLGIPYSVTRDADTERPAWDGRQLWFLEHDSDLYHFHEIMHWLIATEHERTLWDFGLGPNVTFGGGVEQGLSEMVTDRAKWIGQELLPVDVCDRREWDAVRLFFAAPYLLAGVTLKEARQMHWEFGGGGVDRAAMERLRGVVPEMDVEEIVAHCLDTNEF